MTQDNLFRGVGVRVDLPDDDSFLKVKETLTRIGISSRKEKKLYQTCHILHKKGEYAILHFKELFVLDGKESSLSEEDVGRRNTITNLLEEWGLVDVRDVDEVQNPVAKLNQIKILPFIEKSEWELVSKYNVGKRKVK